MERTDAIVAGAGLAGLSCAFELAIRGLDVVVLERAEVVGGRTASWDDNGMRVESGLHRFLGVYRALPDLMERAGIDVSQVVCWEDEIEIRTPSGGRAVLGASPFFNPLRTLLAPVAARELLSPLDLVSLGPFMAAGLDAYVRAPEALDQMTVLDLAHRWHVTTRAIEHLLVPLTAGVFFLPPDRYSAFNFFGLVAASIPRLHHARLGAFVGGMTEMMCAPIAAAIEARSGQVRTGRAASELVVRDGRVRGVVVDDAEIDAEYVVVATSLGAAQPLLEPLAGRDAALRAIVDAPTTPAATIQFELDEPAADVDRATFCPGTAIAAFSEQSRTTFPGADFRVSVILTPPEPFLELSPDEVAARVVADAARVGVRPSVRSFRIVNHERDFLSLEPGHARVRPTNTTGIDGLYLAGDYTKQPFLSTMEGAVLSGRNAAEAIIDRRRNRR